MTNRKWTTENIPDLTGKTVIVTGSNSGIGYEAAKVLTHKNAEVILAVRNLAKGENAKKQILEDYPKGKVIVEKLDLSVLKSVNEFSKSIIEKYNKIDILINNAGVMVPPYTKTKDGFELQFGTNHLGHFVLTALIYELIKNAKEGRIVNVSSAAHKFGKLDFNDLNWEIRKYNDWKAYGASKISNLYFTNELNRRIKKAGDNIVVNSCHPGWTATNLQENSPMAKFLNKFFAQKPEMGALPTLRAAIDPDAKAGSYFGPEGFYEMKGYPKYVKTNELSKDVKIAERLWEVSEEMTKIKFDL